MKILLRRFKFLKFNMSGLRQSRLQTPIVFQVYGFFLLLFIPVVIWGNGIQEDEFDKGNRLYRDNDFSGAITVYQGILSAGYESGELYYNLGNAYFKNGNLGLAILHFEKALKLTPRDEDLRSNLEMARLRVADQVEAPRLAVWEVVDEARDYFRMETLAVVSLVMFLLFLTLAGIYYFLPKSRWKRLAFWAAAPIFILFIFLFSIFNWRIWKDKNFREGVILVEKTDVLSAPDESGQILFALHEGVKARMGQVLPPYVEIILPDGKKGWILGETIIEI